MYYFGPYLFEHLKSAFSPKVSPSVIETPEYRMPGSICTQDPFVSFESIEDVLESFGLEPLGDQLTYEADLLYIGPETVQKLSGPPSLSLRVRVFNGGDTIILSQIGKKTELHAAIKQSPDSDNFHLDHLLVRDCGNPFDIGCGEITGDRYIVERLIACFKESAEYLQKDLSDAIEEPELKLAKRLKPILDDLCRLRQGYQLFDVPAEFSPQQP